MSIEFSNVSYIYNKDMPNPTYALKNIAFTLETERSLGIIGHTGSGKSTLVQLINGLIKPTEGYIKVNGKDYNLDKKSKIGLRKEVGLVFQYPEYQLFEESVYKVIYYGPKNQGKTEEEIDMIVKEVMSLMDLDFEEFSNKSPFELSGGQKRKVAIAGVIAMKPKILILDEPTAGLDPKASSDLIKLLINLKNKMQIIMVSHSMDDIFELCDDVLVLEALKIYMYGDKFDIFSKKEDLLKVSLDIPQKMDLLVELDKRGYSVDYKDQDIFNQLLRILRSRDA